MSNNFSNIPSHYAYKMCSPGIKLKLALSGFEQKNEKLSSSAHVVHTTAKQIILFQVKKWRTRVENDFFYR